MVETEKSKSLELSAERSELAVQRTVMANARTFSAWIRTGLSAVLAGLTIVGFIGDSNLFSKTVTLLAMVIGFLFVGTGIFIYIMAYISYKRNYKALKHEDAQTSISLRFLLVVTSGMTLTAILITLLLILL